MKVRFRVGTFQICGWLAGKRAVTPMFSVGSPRRSASTPRSSVWAAAVLLSPARSTSLLSLSPTPLNTWSSWTSPTRTASGLIVPDSWLRATMRCQKAAALADRRKDLERTATTRCAPSTRRSSSRLSTQSVPISVLVTW